jgi:hypothetical protein
MLAARDQENLVARHHNGAVIKQQQNSRQLPPKTPMKIPLNDENAVHKLAGAKSILTGRPKGNENLTTLSKGTKGLNGGNFVTPMGE